jgi:hypothetical protein
VSRPRAPAGLALLWLAGAAVSGVTLLKGIQPNDEGLMLQAAARIAAGEVPYRDFWWYYPPGQPYLLGGLWAAVGPSLLTWRVVRVAADATVALAVYLLARRRAPRGLALAAWLGAAGAMAFPSGPHPFPIALALALGALLAMERRPALAGALAGLCAVWRLEFAAYLAAGVLLGQAASAESARAWARRALRFAVPAAAVGLALYAPVVAAAGLGPSWDLLVRYPLLDFGDYQSLPFPLDPGRGIDLSSPAAVAASLARLGQVYLPLVLVAGVVAAALVLGLGARGRRDGPLLAVVVFAAGMVHYLLVRPDLFHTAPAAVMLCPLAAWALARRPAPGRAAGAAWAGAGLCGVALAWVVVDGLQGRWAALHERTAPLRLPVADGVRARPAQAADLERVVAAVQRRVPAGEPIYVATRRADLVTSGIPLLYVLAGRPNPTRYDIAAPGVVTSAPVQREIVRDLERARPRVVVRWTDPLTALPEPNRAGRSSGVTLLDGYLRRAYRPVERAGAFVVLARRGRQPARSRSASDSATQSSIGSDRPG